ncbi:MAG: TrmH family RNA methyltransferase [Sphaerochaetaceae bacterium]|nr:TrmH family RNA methyltransferase [Sphaerochaetaceae bacterium]
MIRIRKLQGLEDGTRARKLANIFHEASLDALAYDQEYLEQCIQMASQFIDLPKTQDKRFLYSDISSLILEHLGSSPSDWDFRSPDGHLLGSQRRVLDLSLVLCKVRSPFNVGSIFRSADSFGVKRIYLVEGTADPSHPRAQRTSMGTTETVDYQFVSEEEAASLLRQGSSFALEVGGTPIGAFSFPSSGIAVIGSEELGITPMLLESCKGKVGIPTAGSKGSLNLSVCTGILLQAWFSSLSQLPLYFLT